MGFQGAVTGGRSGWRSRDMIYWNPVIRQMLNASEVIIYGAGVMGKALKNCITDAPYCRRVACFLVESRQNNPQTIDHIPVMELAEAGKYKDILVLVALHEKHMKTALECLRKEGFLNVVPVSFDGDTWSDIRGNWIREKFLAGHKEYLDFSYGTEKNKTCVYVVHSAADVHLSEKGMREFEIPIQAGADLTEEKTWPVRDNQGENISGKNRQYCELTALYWIWKNAVSEYTGLCHYRRRFEISDEQIRRLPDSGIDVVVTVPVLNFPDVRQQYCADHVEKDWDIMLQAVDAICPDYNGAADSVQKGNYYYAYNMFIARREVFVQYCEWLFPILRYCEERIGQKTDSYQNRYPGFLAERLLTIFLEYNRQYKVAVARKHFIECV